MTSSAGCRSRSSLRSSPCPKHADRPIEIQRAVGVFYTVASGIRKDPASRSPAQCGADVYLWPQMVGCNLARHDLPKVGIGFDRPRVGHPGPPDTEMHASWAHFGHTWAQTKGISANYNSCYFAGQPAYRSNAAGTDCARFAFARRCNCPAANTASGRRTPMPRCVTLRWKTTSDVTDPAPTRFGHRHQRGDDDGDGDDADDGDGDNDMPDTITYGAWPHPWHAARRGSRPELI